MHIFGKPKKKRKEGNEENKSYKCKHCEMIFEDKQRLKIHDKKAHSGKGERKKK